MTETRIDMDELRSLTDKLKASTQLDELLLGDLQQLLQETERGETPRWIQSVVDELLDKLDREFRHSRDPHQWQLVIERYPTWENRVNALISEGGRLLEELRELRRRIADCVGDRIPVEVRRDLVGWVRRFADFRHRERQLLLDAANLDVGQGE
ncbi:MAG: hypothetical protein D6725_00710 [Planctomycetota bacterium]|nr:MAG: hypothetical protein D6725_00710 [Planctomycetota bacterium]